jgi:uncharacterized membrane protein
MDHLGSGDWEGFKWLGLSLFALFGTVIGIVFAFIISFIVYQFVKSKTNNDDDEVNLILFCTLCGWSSGLLLTLLTAMVAIACNEESKKCVYSISSNIAESSVVAIGILPSLGVIVGAIIYWRWLRVH